MNVGPRQPERGGELVARPHSADPMDGGCHGGLLPSGEPVFQDSATIPDADETRVRNDADAMPVENRDHVPARYARELPERLEEWRDDRDLATAQRQEFRSRGAPVVTIFVDDDDGPGACADRQCDGVINADFD